MKASSFEQSPQAYVRIAGVLYLAIIALGMYGELAVRGTLVVSGDPAATAGGIEAAQSLWRSGVAADLWMHIFDLPVIVVLYLLLKPVNKPLAQMATAFNLIQTAVLVANKLNLLLPLFVLDDVGYLDAFSTAQRQALAYLAIKAHGYGFGIGLIFFGMACLLRGWLIVRSGLFPKVFGVLLLLAGAAYLVNSFALLVAPSLASTLFPAILLPPFIAELAFSVWMIAKGVNLGHWNALHR